MKATFRNDDVASRHVFPDSVLLDVNVPTRESRRPNVRLAFILFSSTNGSLAAMAASMGLVAPKEKFDDPR